MATKARKKERLEIRCTAEQRRIIDQAVELRGGSLTDFIIDAAQAKAVELIRDFQVIKLNREESIRFADSLLSARSPNAKLRKAARRHSPAT